MHLTLRKLSLVCTTPAAALIVVRLILVVRYTPVAGLNQSGATYQNRT